MYWNTFSQTEPRLVLPSKLSSFSTPEFSENGKLFIIQGENEARIFESESGKELHFFQCKKAKLNSKNELLFQGIDSSISVVNIETNHLIFYIPYKKNVEYLYFSEDNLKIYLVVNQVIEIWDKNKKTKIKDLYHNAGYTYYSALNSNNDILVTAHDTTLILWDLTKDEKFKQFEFHSFISEVFLDPNLTSKNVAQSLVIVKLNHYSNNFIDSVYVLNLKTQNKNYSTSYKRLKSISFSNDGNKVALLSDSLGGRIEVVNKNGNVIETFSCGLDVISAKFNEKNNLLILTSHNGLYFQKENKEFYLSDFQDSLLHVEKFYTTNLQDSITYLNSVFQNPKKSNEFLIVESYGMVETIPRIRLFNSNDPYKQRNLSSNVVGLNSEILVNREKIVTNSILLKPIIWNYKDGRIFNLLDSIEIYGVKTKQNEIELDGQYKKLFFDVDRNKYIDTNTTTQFFEFSKKRIFLNDNKLALTFKDSSLYYWKYNSGIKEFELIEVIHFKNCIGDIQFVTNRNCILVLTNREVVLLDLKLKIKSKFLYPVVCGENNYCIRKEIIQNLEGDLFAIIYGSMPRMNLYRFEIRGDSLVNAKLFQEENYYNSLQEISNFSFNGCSNIFTQSFYDPESNKGGKRTYLKDIKKDSILYFFEGYKSIFNDKKNKIATIDFYNIRIYNLQNGVLENLIKTEIENPIVKFITNSEYLLIEGNGKSIIFNLNSNKICYTRIQLEGLDWLAYDEHYRFDGTPGAIEKLYFVCGLEVVELNQIKDSLYVPNLVQRIMNGENLDHLPKLSELNICGVTPVVEPLENDKSGNQGYRIIPRSGGVGDVDLYINGVVRLSTNSKKLKRKDGYYMLYVEKELLELYQIPGETLQVKVIAKTANNSISSRGVVLDLESDEPTTLRKPSLHAVMIGVDDYKDDNLDLNYAAKDANDLHVALEQASKKFFNVDDTNRVFFYNLTRNREGKLGTDKIKGKTPDKANIIQTLEEIEKKSKPEDILLVFFAGHGEIVDKDQLLLLTTEATSSNFEGIRMRELLEQLNKIPAGKRVLILDACHSGAAINNMDLAKFTGKRDVKDAERQSQRLKELDKLASKSGFAIITASSSDQKALELPQYEHGLMTYALLNAMLNNKSSLDENNQLQLDKWLIATEEEVKKLNQNQSAERMVPVSFTLGKIDDEVRSSIVLKEIPTVFVENVLNKNTFNDNLKIKYMLSSAFQEMSRGTDTQIMVADFPNAIKVNILYEEKGDELKANISLYKENFEQKFQLTGKKANISAFVQELMNQIRTKIQK